MAILAVVALAAFGFLGYHLASSGGHATASPAAVTRPAHDAARHVRPRDASETGVLARHGDSSRR